MFYCVTFELIFNKNKCISWTFIYSELKCTAKQWNSLRHKCFFQVILQWLIFCVNGLYQWTHNGMEWRERNCWKWWLSGTGRQTSKMVNFKTKIFCSSNNNYVLLGIYWAAYTPLRSTLYASGRVADRFTALLDNPKSCLCSSVDFLIRRRLLSSYCCQVVRFHFPVT
jgi:hypothetical protein